MNWSLSLATFNLHNLVADSPPGRLHRLANLVVEHLQAPAILAVQELTGRATDQPTVPGSAAASALTDAIQEAGGPHYSYSEVAPLVNADGGQAGLNIRVGFLFDPGRVSLATRGIDDPQQAVAIHHARPPRLSPNPGRIDPDHPAFQGDPERAWRPSRKALAGEFEVAGETVYLINCHLKSMRARGRRETLHARKQRHAQAELIGQFVRGLLACQPDAPVVVLGDFNDGINSRTLEILKHSGLRNTLDDLPAGLRHTSAHGGMPQTLDHLLISPGLEPREVRIVHQRRLGLEPPVSDHDPVRATLGRVARTNLTPPGGLLHTPRENADTISLVAH